MSVLHQVRQALAHGLGRRKRGPAGMRQQRIEELLSKPAVVAGLKKALALLDQASDAIYAADGAGEGPPRKGPMRSPLTQLGGEVEDVHDKLKEFLAGK